MIDLASALRQVVGALEGSGADYIVVGSAAAAAWGVARMTRDVDLVVVMTESEGDEIVDSILESDLYIHEAAARDAIAHSGSFNVLDAASGGKVDVFVPTDGDAFTRSRIERRIRAEVFGVPCWVATAEDVVFAKLRWRLISRSEVQWRDCGEIAAANRLDETYLREWAPALGVVDDLEELLTSAR